MSTQTTDQTRELPLWLVTVQWQDGRPVTDPGVVAAAVASANAPWGTQPTNKPEEDDAEFGLWLLPLADGAVGALAVDGRVHLAAATVLLEVADPR